MIQRTKHVINLETDVPSDPIVLNGAALVRVYGGLGASETAVYIAMSPDGDDYYTPIAEGGGDLYVTVSAGECAQVDPSATIGAYAIKLSTGAAPCEVIAETVEL